MNVSHVKLCTVTSVSSDASLKEFKVGMTEAVIMILTRLFVMKVRLEEDTIWNYQVGTGNGLSG